MPDEMIKLRKELDKLGVPWEDVSDDKFMKIYRTRFYIGKKRWSVISGSGTYGGEAGLLETWTPRVSFTKIFLRFSKLVYVFTKLSHNFVV